MANPTSDEPAGPHARPSSSEVTDRPTARPWYHPIRLLNYLIEQWFIVGIGVFIVLAWRFPQVAKDDGREFRSGLSRCGLTLFCWADSLDGSAALAKTYGLQSSNRSIPYVVSDIHSPLPPELEESKDSFG
jgi:hypothetical protein